MPCPVRRLRSESFPSEDVISEKVSWKRCGERCSNAPLTFARAQLPNVLENARESLRWLPRMQGRRICQYPNPRHFLLNREAYRLAKGVPLDFERWDATWGIILAPFGGLDRGRSPRGMPGGSAQRGRSEAEEPAGAKPPRGGESFAIGGKGGELSTAPESC